MSSKIYKVNGDHLNAIGEAVGIIVAFLESIKADDALLNFSAAQVLNKLRKPEAVPATLEQAVDDQAERTMANLERKHTEKKAPCHCHCVKGGKHLVAVCPKPKKPAKPLPKTIKEIAAATGVTYKQVQKYAYSHNIGKAGKTFDGHQCRIFTEADVKAILAHFKK